jgi:dienelactone hydrolase
MKISRRNLLSGLTAGAALPWLGPSAARAAATSSLPAVAAPHPLDENHPASHVGNLIGPIARIRDAYGWATESFTSARYRAADHPAWRSKMLDQVFAAMRYAPAQADFAAETVEKVDCGPFIREKIYFNTTPELRVPAYVLVPKVRRGRVPGVVALHDHGAFYRWGKEKLVSTPDEHPSLTAFKKTYYAGRSIADDLAVAGHVVIAIDMFYWGERRMRLPDDPPTGPRESDADVRKFNSARGPLEQLVFRTIATAGFTWAGLIFWDDLRTLDYLAARPEVDPERLGCVGLSVGGWRAAHLTALDRRIKAGVDVCWLTSFKEIQADHVRNTVGFTKILPGLYRQLDMPDVVSLAAPRPLLCINGLQDKLFSVDAGVHPAYHTLHAVYAKLGAAEKFRGHLYDTPHEFNADMQGEAWGWLKRWL